jgi:hydrogenase maturation protein HypF
MQTWKIQINGLVQGVGFRPLVSREAEAMDIKGWVSNTNSGVEIVFNATEQLAREFYNCLIKKQPVNAIITSSKLKKVLAQNFSSFAIRESSNDCKPDILLTPDVAICDDCSSEIADPNNKRYRYPFITCVNCGPRYSIIKSLPYDRVNTTMSQLKMCSSCSSEYNNIYDRRHYSQTNSCNACCIPMHLYNSSCNEISNNSEDILRLTDSALHDGSIVAVKGIGGYLLLCDATNEAAIERLRERKRRPSKPFALLYASLESAEKDVVITSKEREALQSKVAPIVLCNAKKETGTGICKHLVSPDLNTVGVMVPYTGLLALIAEKFDKPLIATSANINGSPIIYTDEDALLWLFSYADYVLSFDREIVVPQDDSVIRFSHAEQQQIIIRRSRGLAPNYFPSPFTSTESLLAMGAELKSSFALLDSNNLYVSQFLGDQGNYESELSFKNTIGHLFNLLQPAPNRILIDKHPGYSVSNFGRQLSCELEVPVTEIQHHKAHFAAVLAESNLIETSEPVLGVVWDGTGYGDDHQIWGGEFFIYEDEYIERVAHLDYFPQIMGDKMSKEPRLSALSLLRNNISYLKTLPQTFNDAEREYFQKLLAHPSEVLTSSMGRLLDGIASVLGVQQINTYEGEATMKLEALAATSNDDYLSFFPLPLINNRIDWSIMMEEILEYKRRHIPACRIAFKVFASLANCIKQTAEQFQVKKVAFSGGVFQNALLVDLIQQLMHSEYQLYFHQQLSPNDECIAFGQIANYYINHLYEVPEEKSTLYLQP